MGDDPRLNISNATVKINMQRYQFQLAKSKLKAVTNTSALLSGFAMVAMVEAAMDAFTDERKLAPLIKNVIGNCSAFVDEVRQNDCIDLMNQDESHHDLPSWILMIYTGVTCLLIGIHILALMISTCILPELQAIDNGDEFGRSHERYYKRFRGYIDIAWISSTVIGIFLFLVEIGLVCFIKFFPLDKNAAFAGAIIMVPLLIFFIIFTFKFYKLVSIFKLEITKQSMNLVDI